VRTQKELQCSIRGMITVLIWLWKAVFIFTLSTYYTELGSDICKNSTNQADLYRLLNYINATVWPRVSDGFEGEYGTPYLHTPRIYVTEDECYDITATSVIPYDFYELSPIITADYITACIPELMDKLSPAIFGVLGGKTTTENAIKYVKTNILKED